MPRSLGGNRPSNTPIEVRAPVANTTSGRWRFGKGTDMAGPSLSARPCYVVNETGQTVYVRTNAYDAGTSIWDTSSASAFDISVADGAQYDISELGSIAVNTVGIWVPTGGTVSQLYIRGFTGD